MSYLNPIKTVPVHTLEAGQAFAKVRLGAPCATPMNFVASYDDVVEAETFDGHTRTMNKYTLVYKL